MKCYLLSIIFLFVGYSAVQAKPIKVFKSQKGRPVKGAKHEMVLSGSSQASLSLSDGETSLAVSANYRFRIKQNIQIEALLEHIDVFGNDYTAFGGGGIYNFAGNYFADQFYGGGGVIVYSGGPIDSTALYGVFGKRFALTRHMVFSPYVRVIIPTDSDSDSLITLVPFSISAVF